jgi:hypothetical protein
MSNKKLFLILALMIALPLFAQQVINGYRIYVAVSAPASPASGRVSVWADSTLLTMESKDTNGVIHRMYPASNPTFVQGSSLGTNSGGGSTLVGSSLTAGSAYYFSSGGLAAAKADATSTVPAVCLAITTTACAYSGVYRFSSSQSWTAGQIIYVSAASAGALVTTAPASSGNQVQRVGVALAADTMLIMPSLDVGGVQ